MWSVGALLELDDRAKMEAFLVQQGGLDLPPVKDGETIFEYLVDESGKWQHWSSRVQEYAYPPNEVPEYASILVPNVDNVRTTFLIDTIAKQNKAVLLIGEQGTAKTVMIKGYSSRYDPEKHLMKAFNFSSASTPLLFQVHVKTVSPFHWLFIPPLSCSVLLRAMWTSVWAVHTGLQLAKRCPCLWMTSTCQ